MWSFLVIVASSLTCALCVPPALYHGGGVKVKTVTQRLYSNPLNPYGFGGGYFGGGVFNKHKGPVVSGIVGGLYSQYGGPSYGLGLHHDIDECLLGIHECEQICINTLDLYLCECEPGFILAPDGFGCLDVDECAVDFSPLPGCSHICVNLPGSFECACDPGYTLGPDLLTCVDVDECLDTSLNTCACSCYNTPGSYICTSPSCGAGTRLSDDGCTCVDVDECALNLHNCPCDCTNTEGSYECSTPPTHCPQGYELSEPNRCYCTQIQCPPGYELSQTGNCVDVDECQTGQHNCQCGCQNTQGGFACTPPPSTCPTGTQLPPGGCQCQQFECGAGYQLNHYSNQCENINECVLGYHNCQCGCVDLEGSYQCIMPPTCAAGTQQSADGCSCVQIAAHHGYGSYSGVAQATAQANANSGYSNQAQAAAQALANAQANAHSGYGSQAQSNAQAAAQAAAQSNAHSGYGSQAQSNAQAAAQAAAQSNAHSGYGSQAQANAQAAAQAAAQSNAHSGYGNQGQANAANLVNYRTQYRDPDAPLANFVE